MGYSCMPFDLHMASLQRFAEEVMPQFPVELTEAAATA